MHYRKPTLSVLQMIALVLLIAGSGWALSPLINGPAARRAAQKYSSQSNLKQIMLSIVMYCQDYDEAFPNSRIGAGTTTPTEQQVTRFLTAKPEAALPSGKNPGYAQIVAGYIANPSVFFSDGDTKRGTVSYWWKYAFDKAAIRNGTIHLSSVPYCDRQIVIYENSSYHTGYTHGIKNAVKLNVGYLDGHVQEVTIKNGPEAYPSKSEQTSGDAAKKLGSPMFFNCRNGTQHSGVADYSVPATDTDSF